MAHEAVYNCQAAMFKNVDGASSSGHCQQLAVRRISHIINKSGRDVFTRRHLGRAKFDFDNPRVIATDRNHLFVRVNRSSGDFPTRWFRWQPCERAARRVGETPLD